MSDEADAVTTVWLCGWYFLEMLCLYVGKVVLYLVFCKKAVASEVRCVGSLGFSCQLSLLPRGHRDASSESEVKNLFNLLARRILVKHLVLDRAEIKSMKLTRK